MVCRSRYLRRKEGGVIGRIPRNDPSPPTIMIELQASAAAGLSSSAWQQRHIEVWHYEIVGTEKRNIAAACRRKANIERRRRALIRLAANHRNARIQRLKGGKHR